MAPTPAAGRARSGSARSGSARPRPAWSGRAARGDRGPATPRARRRIRRRLLALQVAIVLLTVLAVAAVVLRVEDQRTRDLAFEEVDTVATEIAAHPEVIATVNAPDAAERIQPIAHLAERAAGVDFVVVVDRDGLRVAHPDPDLIGLPVSSDHGPVLGGESFRGVEEGPLGVTLRSKVPIWDGDTVVGTVSVGIQQSDVRADLLEVVLGFAPWVLAAAALGTAGAALASRYVRRRIYGAEPEEMAALQQSRQALLHSVGDGVIGVDEHGTITLANDEARRLLGVTGEVEGRAAAEVLEPDVAALLLSPEAADDATRVALAGERILLTRARPAVAAGRRIGRTLTLQDRTELESTLRELKGQRSLTEALRSQTHEFSNRLHVISGLLSLGEPEEAREYIASLTGAVGGPGRAELGDASLSALVGAKAAAAREAGVELEVAPEVSAASRGAGAGAAGAGAAGAGAAGAGVPGVGSGGAGAEGCAVEPGWRADDDTLTVVANLLTNAIEAAGDGGRVRLAVRAGTAGVAVTVDDSGPGMDPAAVDRLFRWGESTKQGAGGAGASGGPAGTADAGPGGPGPAPEAGPVGGRGVGLALVDRIVRRRRGRVDVGTSPLGGARFHAAWPGENGSAGRAAGATSAASTGSAAADSGPGPATTGAAPAAEAPLGSGAVPTDEERRRG